MIVEMRTYSLAMGATGRYFKLYGEKTVVSIITTKALAEACAKSQEYWLVIAHTSPTWIAVHHTPIALFSCLSADSDL